MKLGVLTVPLYSMSFEEAVKYLHGIGVEALEVGAGGYPGKGHFDPDVLLNDPAKIEEIKAILKKYNMALPALSCHGNPVHPNKAEAARYEAEFEKTVLLAEKLGVDTIVGFSGCPGGSPDDKMPNWVTCSWPPEYTEVLDYQWNEVLIPYWKKETAWVAQHGIKKIAFEMHPGFCVYNPSTLLRLREAVGDMIGANFDPSHLIWQGVDPVYAIRKLKGAIYHFHAKDTKLDKYNIAANGVLDTGNYGNVAERSWVFRTVGYGNDYSLWKAIISELRSSDYDGIISIEHEDSFMSPKEGLEKAVEFLKPILIREQPDAMWWA